MGAFTKRWTIDRRRRRREKINRLRRRYQEARSDTERNAIVKKAQQVSPHMPVETFTASMQKRKSQ